MSSPSLEIQLRGLCRRFREGEREHVVLDGGEQQRVIEMGPDALIMSDPDLNDAIEFTILRAYLARVRFPQRKTAAY